MAIIPAEVSHFKNYGLTQSINICLHVCVCSGAHTHALLLLFF